MHRKKRRKECDRVVSSRKPLNTPLAYLKPMASTSRKPAPRVESGGEMIELLREVVGFLDVEGVIKADEMAGGALGRIDCCGGCNHESAEVA